MTGDSHQFLDEDCDYVTMQCKKHRLSGWRLRIFDALAQGRDFMRPEPWKDALSQEQREVVFVISKYEEYDQEIQWNIDEWMSEIPLVSVDTESPLGNALPITAQIAFAHSLHAFIFRLDLLRRQRPEARTVTELLPQHLVNHLHRRTTRVLVSGGDESVHFGPIRTIDVQDLFKRHRHYFRYANPGVSTEESGKSGPSIIGMMTNVYSHEPMKRTEADRWFGHLVERLPETKKTRWHGYSRWPKWRVPLYEWKELTALQLWYMVHDLWLPIAFVFLMVQRDLFELKEDQGEEDLGLNSSLAWGVMAGILERSPSFFRPVFSDSDDELELCISAEEMAEVRDEAPDLSERQSTSKPDPVRNSVTELPYKKRQKSRPYAIPLNLNTTTKALNARVTHPEWGQHCGFCSSTHHTFAFGAESVACPYAKERVQADGRTLIRTAVCLYPRCKVKHLHVTKVCPTLHVICTTCGIRGHLGDCQKTSEWLQRALDDFEQYAHLGLYTSHRFDKPEWGFYPRRKSKFEHERMPDYKVLLEMDPKEAYELAHQRCPVRIMQTNLWTYKHRLHTLYILNRPEQYQLGQGEARAGEEQSEDKSTELREGRLMNKTGKKVEISE